VRCPQFLTSGILSVTAGRRRKQEPAAGLAVLLYIVRSASPALGLVDRRDAQPAGVAFRANTPGPSVLSGDGCPKRPALDSRACRERELWLADGIGFRDPSRLAVLFDHDITGVDLDSRLYGLFLMSWEHYEPARMGSDACVLADREVQHPTAIHADALAYEGVGRLSVAWTLILDPFVDAPCQGLVLRHTALALIVHSSIFPHEWATLYRY
jgi:hypothetical protein